jgi:hypothetical protein
MRLVDLYWAAGFLEGEGHFRAANSQHGSLWCEVQATQAQLEPLLKLQKIFSLGTILERKQQPNQIRPVYSWQVRGKNYGQDAVSIMLTIYDLMSSERQERIMIALRAWRDYRELRRADKSSKYRGVSWNKRNNNWNAYITHRGMKMFIGVYKNEESAARAYDKRAVIFGQELNSYE